MRETVRFLCGALPLYVAALSLLALLVTLFDKLAAKAGWRRVPERSFVLFAALGGGAGVLSGFYLARHKTRHRSLLLAVWLWSLCSYALLIGSSIFFQFRF